MIFKGRDCDVKDCFITVNNVPLSCASICTYELHSACVVHVRIFHL